MADTFKFVVPARPEYVRTVRLAISSLAGSAGFDVEAVEDIKEAVSEACSNLVCHGISDMNKMYEVACEMGGGRIVISISEYEEAKPRITTPLSEECLGMFIIRSLMDEVALLSNGGQRGVRMTKYIHL